MLVEAQVSSMKTSLAASSSACTARHACRSVSTAARSRSAACCVFFKAQVEPVERAPQCPDADLDAVLRQKPGSQLLQNRIRHFGNSRPQNILAARHDRRLLAA